MQSATSVPVSTDPMESAKTAGLQYVTDAMPGFRRKRSGKGFTYAGTDGRVVRDPEILSRIRGLAIPPAWIDVWICPVPHGHLQATGRDAKGRKQHRYHSRWRGIRDETKYDRMIAFGGALPAIRRQTERDLSKPGLPRDKILATVVRLLESTLIRVGNEEYARQNDSFGLTTMRDHHVDINGSTLRFQFRGKSGIKHDIDLKDRRLAKIVKRSQDLPGQELFQYVDEQGECRSIGSADVNDYLRRIAGHDFTAKDFRTWAGTVLVARALCEIDASRSKHQAKRNLMRAIESVAKRLGNTKAVCRKCYIHPAVIDTYLEGALQEVLQPLDREMTDPEDGLRIDEAAILALLERRLMTVPRDDARKAAKKDVSLTTLLRRSLKRAS